MHMQDLIGGIEAILFASANPMTEADLKKVVSRWVISLPPDIDDGADAAVSPLQLETSELFDEGHTDADGAGPAAADAAPAHDAASASQACEMADEQTCAPEAQADGDAQEPVAICDEALQAAGSDAAPHAAGDAHDEEQHDDDASGSASDAGEADSGRLQRATAVPKLAAVQQGVDEPCALDAADEVEPEAAAYAGDAAEAAQAAEGAEASDTSDEADSEALVSQDAHQDGDAPPEATYAQVASSMTPTPFDWRKHFKAAVAAVKARWQDPPESCGFTLIEVADALTFRSNPRFAPALLAMRDEKPPKLSRAAMETLAIIAYRQPVTKPESDHIRGVDCGGTIKMLLDRNLIRIVGKKEEPGRPLLYGTGPEFLSFFNLASVHHLPSLRAFDELNDDSEDALRELDALPSLQELSAQAKQFRLDDEPAMGSLDAAVDALRRTESTSRDALAAQGITLAGDEEDKPAAAPAPTQH